MANGPLINWRLVTRVMYYRLVLLLHHDCLQTHYDLECAEWAIFERIQQEVVPFEMAA